MEIVRAFQVFENDPEKTPFAAQDKPGRWTSGNAPAIYASCEPSTAMLEFLAHLHGQAHDGICCARTALRREWIEEPESLPEGWRDWPYRSDVQQMGDGWLASCRSPVLRVPSVLVPGAYNLIINPACPEWRACTTEHCEVYRLDSRLA
ncbi:RES family NAD+ phosphorylase [Pseudoxanthomonas helianthi]|uniref:RES family NAD+ phosphorylase n=1 Tax=Pseudoxanthomonas helianthi TaxID=1453541 RepID=A0A940WYL2_9GAMM|nr:RES family NAD+ phosphorylase [Pseudoxanthomonas helianthi]MBP3983393.1 RES family NAD+ phosphorylase [Pseudoxanthomonas helianthi]